MAAWPGGREAAVAAAAAVAVVAVAAAAVVAVVAAVQDTWRTGGHSDGQRIDSDLRKTNVQVSCIRFVYCHSSKIKVTVFF